MVKRGKIGTVQRWQCQCWRPLPRAQPQPRPHPIPHPHRPTHAHVRTRSWLWPSTCASSRSISSASIAPPPLRPPSRLPPLTSASVARGKAGHSGAARLWRTFCSFRGWKGGEICGGRSVSSASAFHCPSEHTDDRSGPETKEWTKRRVQGQCWACGRGYRGERQEPVRQGRWQVRAQVNGRRNSGFTSATSAAFGTPIDGSRPHSETMRSSSRI